MSSGCGQLAVPFFPVTTCPAVSPAVPVNHSLLSPVLSLLTCVQAGLGDVSPMVMLLTVEDLTVFSLHFAGSSVRA